MTIKTISICAVAGLILSSMASSVFAADVAKVNGQSITDRDVQMALSSFNEGQRKSVLSDANSRRQIVSNLVEQEVLMQEAEKEKLDQDQDYKDALSGFKKQFLASRLLQKNLASKMNDKTAKKFYEAHKSKYSTDQVQVQHILVADEATARDILKKAQAKDADFQALAEKYSKDPSAKNNRGDLGVITHDSPFVPEFKDAAFEGSKGDLIGPIKTLYGYHIIKIVDKKIGKPLAYDEIELKVKSDLRQELIQVYVSELKKQAKLSYDEKAIEKL